jgi:hypothetical protein
MKRQRESVDGEGIRDESIDYAIDAAALCDRSNHMTKTDSEIAHPAIVSQEEWLVERKKLLDQEKL